MKKSNKLLLSGFLTVVLLIATIHIAVYAKYKNGKFTIYHREDRLADIMQPFPNVSHVTIRNVYGAIIVFSDRAEVEKDKNKIQYVQKGDSLVITGLDRNSQLNGGHVINIILPFNVTLSAFNSLLYFEKGKKTADNNPVIYLQKTHALFLDKNNPLLLQHVKLVASDSSTAAFHGNIQVNDLEVQLSNSALEYNEGDAGTLSIVTDSVSRISLLSKHLLKAKITTIPVNP
ncbi:MAG: hypothetical protein ABIR18_13680 [Chitinophagaceae bacterium]